MGELAIEVQGLTKSYGDRVILNQLNLNVRMGETYALLGQNGAGKSTTIEILEGFRKADSGFVRVLGVDPSSATAPSRQWRAQIGIVAQQTGSLGPFTVREILRRFAGMHDQPRGIAEVLELVGLTEQAEQRASKLSGGQQRRLDVALGIIGRPKLVFLDEPTTGFDPAARRQFWSMLQGLSQDGTAILLTTHYLDEAAYLADRVGVLNGGVLVAEAAPDELGGAEARVPVVSWRDPDGVMQRQRTAEPAALIAQLVATHHGEPAELQVRRPELEEIYLGLLGQPVEGGGVA